MKASRQSTLVLSIAALVLIVFSSASTRAHTAIAVNGSLHITIKRSGLFVDYQIECGHRDRSKLIAMHDKGHHDVKLSREEMDKLAAWIDLVVPFCGDYVEANAWSEAELNRARERIQLRQEMDAIEQQSIAELVHEVVNTSEESAE